MIIEDIIKITLPVLDIGIFVVAGNIKLLFYGGIELIYQVFTVIVRQFFTLVQLVISHVTIQIYAHSKIVYS